MKVTGKPTTIEVLFVAAAVVLLAAVGAQYAYTARQVQERPWSVSTVREDGEERPAQTQDVLVDINTATEEQLQALPGIGPVLARRILEYRQEKGPFTAAEELLEVDGIGQATLDKLREHITLGQDDISPAKEAE